MVLYRLTLKNKNTPDLPDVIHELDLSPSQEDNPEALFKGNAREELRQILQEQTAASITNASLQKIIDRWLDDIREGYRLTPLTLTLAPLEFDNLKNLKDQGNPTPPPFVPPDFSEISPQRGALPPLNFN